jgi:hypothetical protein
MKTWVPLIAAMLLSVWNVIMRCLVIVADGARSDCIERLQ